MFDEIDAIVCWCVTEQDEACFRNRGITLEVFAPSAFGPSEPLFPHATHLLVLSGLTNPIYVLDLKKIIGE